MQEPSKTSSSNYGSSNLNKIVERLQGTSDPRRRYEYVLWLAKALPPMPQELKSEQIKVKGCVSEVHILGRLVNGKLAWVGDSDALITRGLLAMLIKGLSDLSPQEVMDIDPSFIKATGLHGSLTPSRANGFLNILLSMKSQAQRLAMKESRPTSS